MIILDTNTISVLERGGAGAERLLTRLANVPSSEIFVTVISYEEQVRGWIAAIAATKNANAQVMQYARLMAQLANYCQLSILPYDAEAARRCEELRKLHRRISSPDLKIAAIALQYQATLITQNERDFHSIAHLTVEDWTR